MVSGKKDYLTGLLSRQGLYEWYEGLSGECTLQFMFMDLDNFKNVNDTYGHNEGDNLLKAVAEILKSYQDNVVCARYGGDEFVLVVPGECDREQIERIAKDIIKSVKSKEGFSYISTDISASIGILLDERRQESLNDILYKIDAAMYQAKAKGKSDYVIFNDIADVVYDEVKMEQRQKEALQRNEFEVCYYPIIRAKTSKLFISEVCLMWNQPDGRRRYPWEFMPLFEKNGFICTMDIWAIQQVCGHLKKYREETGIRGRIAVPISKLLLFNSSIVQTLLEVVKDYGVEPQELVLEVGEGDFTRRSGDIVQRLRELKEAGFGVGIIEVGVNFASMCYWDKIEIDYIRFCGEYLKDVLCTDKGRRIVKALISMGRNLEIEVIADGIETQEDMLFLRGCGCDAICGSFYSVSLPVEEYCRFIADRIEQGK